MQQIPHEQRSDADNIHEGKPLSLTQGLVVVHWTTKPFTYGRTYVTRPRYGDICESPTAVGMQLNAHRGHLCIPHIAAARVQLFDPIPEAIDHYERHARGDIPRPSEADHVQWKKRWSQKRPVTRYQWLRYWHECSPVNHDLPHRMARQYTTPAPEKR